MTVVLWLLVIVLLALVTWLLLALAGATRTIASLRAGGSVEGEDPTRHLSTGLAAGTRAPSIEGLGDDLHGSRHLVTFVDPDCAACDELVPALIRAAGERRVPQAVLVSQGSPAAHPAAWLASGPRSQLVMETGSAATDAYEVDVTPTAFLVDEGGLIVGGGPTETIDDVLVLVDELQGVRIAPETAREQDVFRGSL
jgi:hypothetical protein